MSRQTQISTCTAMKFRNSVVHIDDAASRAQGRVLSQLFVYLFVCLRTHGCSTTLESSGLWALSYKCLSSKAIYFPSCASVANTAMVLTDPTGWGTRRIQKISLAICKPAVFHVLTSSNIMRMIWNLMRTIAQKLAHDYAMDQGIGVLGLYTTCVEMCAWFGTRI